MKEGKYATKTKVQKEEIVAAAMKVVSEKGIESLTAQELRNILNLGSLKKLRKIGKNPLFTRFSRLFYVFRYGVKIGFNWVY